MVPLAVYAFRYLEYFQQFVCSQFHGQVITSNIVSYIRFLNLLYLSFLIDILSRNHLKEQT